MMNDLIRMTQQNNERLLRKFEQYEAVNVEKYRSFVRVELIDGTEKEIWSEAFQRALNENKRVFIPRGKYYMDRSIVLSSNRQIVADCLAEICVKKGAKVLLLRNDAVVDGSYRVIDEKEGITENISIEGGIWSEECETRLGYGKSGAYDEANSLVGVSTCLLFSGVKNLSIRNLTLKHSGGFAIQIGRCENFCLENIKFEGCFADGVHINGFVKNGLVKDISGHTEDDLVALNMYDWENSTITNGPLENVVVQNVLLEEGHRSFRIQTGVVPMKNGEIDCYIKNLYLRNIKGIAEFKMYLQTPRYMGNPEGTRVGRMENVYMENIDIYVGAPLEGFERFQAFDSVIGHYGAFEVGSNISNLTLKNINVYLDKVKYPTAHFMTVGPKSCYFEKENLEIFDPYIKCEVQKIEYENIFINGEKIENLRDEIYEISFKNLYNGVIDDGYGRVNVIKNMER